MSSEKKKGKLIYLAVVLLWVIAGLIVLTWLAACSSPVAPTADEIACYHNDNSQLVCEGLYD